jgi:peptidoglycan/LPS O-acetylase OafA/YrhL
MRYLGRISFALYLYDGLAQWLSWRLRYAGVSIWGPRHFLVSLTIALLLASISYYLIERPFLRLKERLSSAEEPPVRLQRAA